MDDLFEGRLAPITCEIGFLECDCSTAVQRYLEWSNPIQAKRGVGFVTNPTHGTLEQVLKTLLPLNSVERRRFLFIPTKANWTAYFDNGHQSTDAFAPMSYMAEQIGCRGVKAVYVPEGLVGRYPARILEMYAPHRTDWLNIVRTWAAIADGNNWTFETSGTIQPFERLEQYHKDPVSERFTPRMLELYLDRMGLRPFEENFYLSDKAVLVEKHGPIAPLAKEFGLTGS